jgi:diguanylate cyclase (GGDEF)-like protein
MLGSNEQLTLDRVRIPSSQLAGIFILISVLVVIMGLIIYDKQLVDPDVFAASGIVIIILLLTIFLFAWKLAKRLDEAYNKLKLVAITDGLTQLFNKKHFNTLFENELNRAMRHERDLSCYILGIDHFKIVLDKYGYQFGNEVLQDSADVIKDNSRSTDIVARYARDKFICLLPETNIESAMILSKRLRALVEGETFSFGEDRKIIPVTVSIGVSTYKPSMGKERNINEILNLVDKALNTAKENGRNRVEYLIWE